MPLIDPLNGVYRAGFAYQQKSFAETATITLTPAVSSGSVTLTIPQMIDAATLSFQLQIVTDTASKSFTALLRRNLVTIASYTMNSNIGSEVPPNSYIIVDTSISLNGVAFANETFSWLITEPDISVATSTVFSATLSVQGVPI